MARKNKREAESDFGGQPAQQSARLTPVDIQQKVFRLAFRGYNERDVDEFLDRVTEALAALHEENKRLREQGGGGGGGEDVAEARAQAESIVREAREHAARLTEDAGIPAAPGAGGLTASFLLREREFLQRMASSVQEHARWLKEEAQRQQAVPVSVSGSPKAETGTQAAAGGVGGKESGNNATASTTVTPESAGVGEATAAWGPAQPGTADPAAGWTEGPRSGEPDPLLSAWESAFTAEGPEGHSRKTVKEGEPSLKELFWGEE